MRPLVVNIIVSNIFTRVLLYMKMLKESEKEKTIGIFVIFLSLVTFQSGRGGRVSWNLSLATPMSTLYRTVQLTALLLSCVYYVHAVSLCRS